LCKSFFSFWSILTFFCPCGGGITFAFLLDFLRPCVLTNFLLTLLNSTIAISSNKNYFKIKLQTLKNHEEKKKKKKKKKICSIQHPPKNKGNNTRTTQGMNMTLDINKRKT